MGEAAYNDAKAKGELIEQRLRAIKWPDFWVRKEDTQELCKEAAETIEWLSKERDSLIGEVEKLTTALKNAHAKVHGHAWELDRIRGELRGEADNCWNATCAVSKGNTE